MVSRTNELLADQGTNAIKPPFHLLVSTRTGDQMPRLQDWLTRAEQEEQGKAGVNSKSCAEEDAGKCLHGLKQTVTKQGPRRMYRHPDGSIQASLPTPNPYAEAARWKWTRLVECCQDDKKRVLSTSLDSLEDSPWKEYVEPLSDPFHPFNTFMASQALSFHTQRLRGKS